MREQLIFNISYSVQYSSVVCRQHQKITPPQEKFDICGILANIFTKITTLTDEDSLQIYCKFY